MDEAIIMMILAGVIATVGGIYYMIQDHKENRQAKINKAESNMESKKFNIIIIT